MTKILFVFGGIPQMGGTEAVMSTIYRTIDVTRFHIDFLFFGDPKNDTSAFTHDVSQHSQVFYVPRLRDSIQANHQGIETILKEHRYDIIHTHMDASGTDVLRIAQKCGVKVRIAHSHNTGHLENIHGLKAHLHRVYIDWQKSRITKYATHYIGCSRAAGEWLFGKSICKQDNFMVFRNAIDVEKYAFNPEIRENLRNKLQLNGKKVIGHVGRFDYQKNHPYLIDIFSKVYAKDHSAELFLIGNGADMPKIQEQVKNLGLEEHVHFLGNQSNVNEWLQCFDVFVMPSHYEGLGIVLIEAQAAGLPCFASDIIPSEASVSNLIEFIDLALNSEVWANKILKYFENPLPRVSPVQQIYKKGYDSKFNIKELENFYEKSFGNH